MSSSSEGEASAGSLIHTRPRLSHTNIRPESPKVMPKASVQVPPDGITVSENPAGTVAARSVVTSEKQHIKAAANSKATAPAREVPTHEKVFEPRLRRALKPRNNGLGIIA